MALAGEGTCRAQDTVLDLYLLFGVLDISTDRDETEFLVEA